MVQISTFFFNICTIFFNLYNCYIHSPLLNLVMYKVVKTLIWFLCFNITILLTRNVPSNSFECITTGYSILYPRSKIFKKEIEYLYKSNWSKYNMPRSFKVDTILCVPYFHNISSLIQPRLKRSQYRIKNSKQN